VKHQHLFSYGERMNFPYLPLLKFHSLTPLLYVFSSLSALLKPARSPFRSHRHTWYRVSPPSQHRFTEPDHSYSFLDILMPFLFTISLKFPHSSSLYSFPPSRFFINSSFTYLCYLFSPALELPTRIVPPLTTAGKRFTDSMPTTEPFIELCVGQKQLIPIS